MVSRFRVIADLRAIPHSLISNLTLTFGLAVLDYAKHFHIALGLVERIA